MYDALPVKVSCQLEALSMIQFVSYSMALMPFTLLFSRYITFILILWNKMWSFSYQL